MFFCLFFVCDVAGCVVRATCVVAQDAFFEVFGVDEGDVRGVVLTEEELQRAPRWWYKPKEHERQAAEEDKADAAVVARVARGSKGRGRVRGAVAT